MSFAAVEIGARPRPGDLVSILRLRRLLTARGGTDVVHAHGLRAGALSLIALTLVRGGRRPRTVVTAHNAPPPGGGAPALVYRLLERLVARRADLVLCVSPDLEARMRAAGARRVEQPSSRRPTIPLLSPAAPWECRPAGRSSSAPGGWRRRRGSACCSRRPPLGGTWIRRRSW